MRERGIYIAFIVCMIAGFNLVSVAQYSSTNSQYMFNGLILNPAYAGAGNVAAVSLNYRNQWTGFSGSPETQTLSGHTPLRGNTISVGGILTHDKIGVNSDLNLMGVASYKIEYRRSQLNFGLGAGIGLTQSRWSDVVTEQENDQLFQNDKSSFRPLFSMGMYYENKDWYAGYSAPMLLSYSYVSNEKLKPFFSPAQMEHDLTAGMARRIGRGVTFKPSFLLKVIPTASYQLDLNANFIFQEKYWAGISVRMDRSVIVLLEYQINLQFRIGYAYDHGFNALARNTFGSHELMLIWQKKNRSLARSPRYF
jgi:type IX secretion system PorP/SprF family membrane protein